jgi:hypothetical protein
MRRTDFFWRKDRLENFPGASIPPSASVNVPEDEVSDKLRQDVRFLDAFYLLMLLEEVRCA